MKGLMNSLAIIMLAVQVIVPAHAQQPSPKSTEVPEVRKPEGKSTEDQELRRKVKRKAATPESQKAKGGELGKPEGKSTEGSTIPPEQKKQ